jgi:hypothetical protein
MSWPPAIGELLPRAEDAYGALDKLRGYSLNLEHDVGTHKARVFRSVLGITPEDADWLAAQLLTGVCQALVSAVRDNAPHGVLCEVLVPVAGVGGRADRTAVVTTSWEYSSPEARPRLVSAYIEA